MGKVISSHTDSNQCTTYEICDAFAPDIRIAKRLTVVRYPGNDLVFLLLLYKISFVKISFVF